MPKFDPRLIFLTAESFRLASGIMGHASTVEGRQVLVPSLVCIAFACELYLKCLITIEVEKGFTKVHKLGELFRQLPANIQQTVRQRAAEAATKKREIYEQLLKPAGIKSPPLLDFDEALKRSEDAFVKWRYPFDETAPEDRAWHATEILNAIRDLIIEREPSWLEEANAVPPPVEIIEPASSLPAELKLRQISATLEPRQYFTSDYQPIWGVVRKDAR